MDDYTTTERVGLVVAHLYEGDGLRIADAVALTGMSANGVRKMLCRLSRVLPIYCHRGIWQHCALHEIEDLM